MHADRLIREVAFPPIRNLANTLGGFESYSLENRRAEDGTSCCRLHVDCGESGDLTICSRVSDSLEIHWRFGEFNANALPAELDNLDSLDGDFAAWLDGCILRTLELLADGAPPRRFAAPADDAPF